MDWLKALGFGTLLAGLTYIFVRNLLDAKGDGVINTRRGSVRRTESPFNFWFSVGTYVFAAIVCAVATVGCLYVLVTMLVD